MRNSYLETLELSEGATKSQIKKAYRKLSKKYHPDVSKDIDANAKFIAITEAYKFLSDVGPRPTTIRASQQDYGYDVHADTYHKWRKKAQEYAQKKSREAIRRQTESIKYILRIFNSITAIMLIFNISLEVDRHMTPIVSHERILSEELNFENISYDVIEFEKHTMRFTPKEIKRFKKYTSGEIYSSAIYDIPMYVILKGQNVTKRFNQEFSAIGFFSIFIKIVFLCFILYQFVFKTLDTQLSLAIFMMFIYIFQLYIFLI